MGRKWESSSALFPGSVSSWGFAPRQLAGKGLCAPVRGSARCRAALRRASALCCSPARGSALGGAPGMAPGNTERPGFLGGAPGVGGATSPARPAPAHVRRSRQEGVFPQNLFSRSPGILPRLSPPASSFYEAASFPGSPFPSPSPPLSLSALRFYLFVYNTSPVPRTPFILETRSRFGDRREGTAWGHRE